MADSNGVVNETASYDSFGNKITSNLTTRYQYTGREYDEYTGLMFYRARFYDPQIGRFISEDPIGFRGGINWYSYVNNNPIRHRDPSGLIGLYAYPDGTPSNPHNIIEYYDAYNDIHYRRVWGHQRYPGEENSAMRHCVVSCESGSLWGAGTVRMMGDW